MASTLERPATPPRLSATSRLRLAAAVGAGQLAATLSRIAGKGSGVSVRGQVMTRIDPDALTKLLQGRRIAAVSGTNGKTTTTHLLAAAVRAGLGPRDADRVVTNADGANLHYGIASALSQSPRADIAILETDERVVADIVRLGRPEVLVLLNFSRDQLDRNHEIKKLARSWRDALAAAGDDGPVVVANAEEPLVVWAAKAAKHVIWIDTASTWQEDAIMCPECGAILLRRNPHPETGDPGDWDCPACWMSEPIAVIRVENGQIVDRHGVAHDPQLQVPGGFNVGNAACALAAAEQLGVGVTDALAGMRTVTSPAGRFATTHFGTTSARLLLAKNPAGWHEALPLLQSDTVVLAIDAVAADGRDLSWMWDVNYEQLAGKKVIATGPRAQDLAVRLAYAEVECTVVPDLATALTDRGEHVDVLSTYTPFQKLRKLGGLA
ncbi:DUF1727 domain-containing protein [Raineyella fluvialis]|uniref:Lipid II isoglutaminyl synthase (glutamine-hydrolyzing) subunit MurT n=2 Tax=Raineyella fluvialis TaxID=2662261 RepID=A0A5Q2F9H5_9ACTN|nr:DUF1727 domain-containing protein [Raineyella fluvialis]